VKWIRADRINADQWVILGRHYDDQETCHPMRWWLIRQGDEWRLADLQFIDMNLRLSALMVVGFEQAPAVWPEIRTFARLLQVVDRFKEGNLDDSEIEQMIVLTERLEHTKLPVELKSTILLCRVLGLAYQEELDPALEALDQMEKLSPNTPIVHELRGQIYASQERFGLAIPQFLKYGQMVGFDASLYESMADAAMADGKEEQSATYARLGLADQPESLGCLASLAAVLPVPQLSELDPYFKRHQHSEEMLSMVIDWCLSSEKMPAARYAYRALKKHQPQSELIEDLRSRLDYADY
jgi:tetratricopeptide (TPR) repeat protein